MAGLVLTKKRIAQISEQAHLLTDYDDEVEEIRELCRLAMLGLVADKEKTVKKTEELPWKDATSYTQGTKDRGGAHAHLWELVSGDVRIHVHGLHGCKGWFLTLWWGHLELVRSRYLGDEYEDYLAARAEGLRLSAYTLQEKATFLQADASRIMEKHTGLPTKKRRTKA